jgi:hypothetical protein
MRERGGRRARGGLVAAGTERSVQERGDVFADDILDDPWCNGRVGSVGGVVNPRELAGEGLSLQFCVPCDDRPPAERMLEQHHVSNQQGERERV